MYEEELPNTSIPNNSNGHPGREASKAAGKARGQVGITIKEIVRLSLGVYPGANDNRNNQPINTQHSSHNHRHYRLHHKLRPHHTHRRHSHPTLRSSVRCSHTGENESRGSAEEAEERSGFVATEICHGLI
ncbi:hypothetical protein V8G54_036801 [Vigna mungo]|uniref:Uncharacterized protein n=1 Tax=Vigna mungo TaxID=3915 RepID=A0AAQ3RFY5_VIGMU